MLIRLKHSLRDYAHRRFADRSSDEACEHAAFADWLVRERGWRVLAAIVATATVLSAVVRVILGWKLSWLASALAFDVCALGIAFGMFAGWTGYRRIHDRWISMTLEGLLGAATVLLVILGVGAWLTDQPPFELFEPQILKPLIAWLLVFLVGFQVIVVLIATLRKREREAVTKLVDAERRQSDLARRLAESELRLLRAQIEPHFLFNTLGSAQQLAEQGAPQAAHLIADLIQFLRAATSLHADRSTVATEVGLVKSYLSIMSKRLGPRLRYQIHVDDSLDGAPLAPGMLITLAENAVKHGIEPLPDGGEVFLSARRAGDTLEISVADTGPGLTMSEPGQGLGLANIRERLALLYGANAALELEQNRPRGFLARLRVPLLVPSPQSERASA